MYSRRARPLAAAVITVAALLGGCAESSLPVATGKGEIRGINAIATAPDTVFRIEERLLGTVAYKGVSDFNSYDDLTYNFNFDIFLPRETDAARVHTHSLDVAVDTRYTIVLTGTVDQPSSLQWEDAPREFADSDTVFEAWFAHLAPSVGEVDVYFAPTGTPPVNGAAVGTVSNGQRLPSVDFQDGEYELILTAPGDTSTVLYHSTPLNSSPQTQVTFAIFDPDPSITSNVAVNLINAAGLSTPIANTLVNAELRMLHAAFGVENVDGYLEEDFSAPVYPDVGFRQLAAYSAVEQVGITVTLTPVGNSGATIVDGIATVPRNSRRTAVFGGTLAAPFLYIAADQGRPLEPYPSIRLINMTSNLERVAVFVLDEDQPIEETILPTIGDLPARSDTGFFGVPAGPQEITITEVGERTAIATPLSIDLEAGDLAEIAIVDTADPSVLELVLFDSR